MYINSNDPTYLDGNIQIGNIPKRPIDNTLDIVFSNMLGNGLNLEQLPILVRHESIL